MNENENQTIEISQDEAKMLAEYRESNAFVEKMIADKKKKNSKDRFVMLEQGVIWRLTQQFTSIHEYAFFNYLMEKMNQTNSVMVSQKLLMKILGTSRQTIHKTVSRLEYLNIIKIIKIGTANCYVVNSDVVWKKSRDTKEKTSIFNCTVVADWDEQSVEYKSTWDTQLQPVPRRFIQEQQALNYLEEQDQQQKQQ